MEGVRLSKDALLGAARKNAQLVARLRSQAEPPVHSCRAPAAIIKKLISEPPPNLQPIPYEFCESRIGPRYSTTRVVKQDVMIWKRHFSHQRLSSAHQRLPYARRCLSYARRRLSFARRRLSFAGESTSSVLTRPRFLRPCFY